MSIHLLGAKSSGLFVKYICVFMYLNSMCIWGGICACVGWVYGVCWRCLGRTCDCLQVYVLVGLRRGRVMVTPGCCFWKEGWSMGFSLLRGGLRFHLEASRRSHVTSLLLGAAFALNWHYFTTHIHMYVCTYNIWVLYGWLCYTSLWNSSRPSHAILVCPIISRICLRYCQTVKFTFHIGPSAFNYEGDWISLCTKTYSLILEHTPKHFYSETSLKCRFWI